MVSHDYEPIEMFKNGNEAPVNRHTLAHHRP